MRMGSVDFVCFCCCSCFLNFISFLNPYSLLIDLTCPTIRHQPVFGAMFLDTITSITSLVTDGFKRRYGLVPTEFFVITLTILGSDITNLAQPC